MQNMNLKTKMLKMFLLLIFTHCAIAECTEYCYSNKNTEKVSVLILGAGVSGISAAKKLSENGVHNFKILETHHEIGGRLFNINWPKGSDSVIEVGANWIQGVNGDRMNPIKELADRHNLSTIITNFDDATFLNKNGRINDEKIHKSKKKFERVMDKVATFIKERRRQGLVDMDARTAMYMMGWNPENEEGYQIDQMIEYSKFDYEIAESPDRTSLNYALDYATYKVFGQDQEFVKDPRGYKHLIEQEFINLDRNNKYPNRLHLNTTVASIKYADQNRLDINGVIVTTTDGRRYEADYVICTFSLGVLRHSDIQFQPKLPSWKVESLNRFHMNIYLKIFVSFDKKFWGDEEFFYYADEKRGYYPAWQNMNAGAYTSAFPDQNILMVTVTGEEGKRIERLKDEEVMREIQTVLRKLFGKSPNYVDPNQIYVPRWSNQKRFRGSYSNWAIGVTSPHFSNMKAPISSLKPKPSLILNKRKKMSTALFKNKLPENNVYEYSDNDVKDIQRVWFAGEHTSKDYFGYAHGAWESGIEIGNDVSICINDGECADKPIFKKIKSCSD